MWGRAFGVVASGTSEQLDTFLRGERARLRLRSLERLPPKELRTVEMFGDRVAVLIHDKALLDEEDIFSAKLLIYGKSDRALVKAIGPRWFMTPGPVGGAGAAPSSSTTPATIWWPRSTTPTGALSRTEALASGARRR